MSVSSVARPASVNDLPKMKATLPLSIQGEYGLNMGEAWWIDRREAVFWSPEKMPTGRDLLTRVDFHRGTTIDVTLRIVDSEVPARYRNGYVHIARWIPRTPDDGKVADQQLRALNPQVFARDYIAPRLPEGVAPVAVAPVQKEERKGPSEAELLRQKMGADLAEAEKVIDRLKNRRWRTRLAWMTVGAMLGVFAGLGAEGFRSLRALAWRLDPSLTLEYGLLAQAPLDGQNFAGAKLAGADLRGSRLAGASLAGADLARAQLGGADLGRADLTGASLAGASLVGASLHGTNFSGADLRGADVSADTSTASFRGALFSQETRWTGGQVPEGAFGPGAQSAGASLDGVDVTGANLEGINLAGASLRQAKLNRTTLVAAALGGAKLDGSDLTGADLSRARMIEVSCSPCTLREARLDGVDASRSSMVAADLGASRATSIALVGADLRRADLRDAEWTDADLRGAKFAGARLGGVRMSGCLLLGADLAEADLVGARLESCVADQRTVWPPSTLPGALGAVVMSPGALLQGAKLAPGADLRGQSLAGIKANRLAAPQADFAQAVLDGADLSEANLDGAEFASASLRKADLRNANLTGARFGGADLTGALLGGARICGTDLTNARMDRTRFDGAVACVTTRWPNNRPPEGVRFE